MDPALGGAELEQLLAVLLRLLSPAAVRPGSNPGGNDHDGGPAPPSPVATGGAPGGAAPADSAPDGSEPGHTRREGSAPGDRTPGAGAAGYGTPGDTTPGGGAPAGLPAVTASEARALTELLAAHGIAQGQLAALLGLEKSTVSRLAAGLESKGWIRRGRDEQNHRYVRLYLTPQGRAVADRIWQAWQSRQARILAGLTAEERAGLATGLRGVLRGLVAEGLLAAPPRPNGRS
jgi:DNA-binding MarR family transcriptional regulator